MSEKKPNFDSLIRQLETKVKKRNACEKVGHKTRLDAKAALKNFNKFHREKVRKATSVYKCPECGYFHITTMFSEVNKKLKEKDALTQRANSMNPNNVDYNPMQR